MTKDLLLIFTRNPELGKCKTRLAATIGDVAALDVYRFLLIHTVTVTANLAAQKQVHYSVKIRDNDVWDDAVYEKKQQMGEDLGERMMHAFKQGFKDGYERIIIIGSDLFDLSQTDLENAFHNLKENNYVIGPAEDGGYYLLGMKQLNPNIFQNKKWGTASVLKDTLANLGTEEVHMLPERNDVDYYDDIKDIEAFQPFLKHLKNT
ncbi:MAG: TIGR04282 family arsenosugar biosynthesis glycosyltransferase [Aureisphaera sp.]